MKSTFSHTWGGHLLWLCLPYCFISHTHTHQTLMFIANTWCSAQSTIQCLTYCSTQQVFLKSEKRAEQVLPGSRGFGGRGGGGTNNVYTCK
jgi:hypothetical protein